MPNPNPTKQTDAVVEARRLTLTTTPEVSAALKTLADEVEALHERFSVVCSECGEHYLGPKDETLHGYNVCNMSRCED